MGWREPRWLRVLPALGLVPTAAAKLEALVPAAAVVTPEGTLEDAPVVTSRGPTVRPADPFDNEVVVLPMSFAQMAARMELGTQMGKKPCMFCSSGGTVDDDEGQDQKIIELKPEGKVLSDEWMRLHHAAKTQLEMARTFDDKVKSILHPVVEEQCQNALAVVEEYLTWYVDEEDYWFKWFKDFKKEIRFKQVENAIDMKQQLTEHTLDVKKIKGNIKKWDKKARTIVEDRYPFTHTSALGGQVLALSDRVVRKFESQMTSIGDMNEEKIKALADKLDAYNGRLKKWMKQCERIKLKLGKGVEFFTFGSIEMKAQLTESLRRVTEAQVAILKRLQYIDSKFEANKEDQDKAIEEYLMEGTEMFEKTLEGFEKEASETFAYVIEDIQYLDEEQAKATEASQAKIEKTVEKLMKKQRQSQAKVTQRKKEVGEYAGALAEAQFAADTELANQMGSIEAGMRRQEARAETGADALGTDLYNKLSRITTTLADNDERTANKIHQFSSRANDRRTAMRDTLRENIASEQRKFDGREERMLTSFDQTLNKWRSDWGTYEATRDVNPVTKAPAWATITEASNLQKAVDDLLEHSRDQSEELIEDINDESADTKDELDDMQMDVEDAQYKTVTGLEKDIEYMERDLDRGWEEGEQKTEAMLSDKTKDYLNKDQASTAELNGAIDAEKNKLSDAANAEKGAVVDSKVDEAKSLVNELDAGVRRAQAMLDHNLRAEEGQLQMISGTASERIAHAADFFSQQVDKQGEAASTALKANLEAATTQGESMLAQAQDAASSAQHVWLDATKSMNADVAHLTKAVDDAKQGVHDVKQDAEAQNTNAKKELAKAEQKRKKVLTTLADDVDDKVSQLASELEAKLDKAEAKEKQKREKMEQDAQAALNIAEDELPQKIKSMKSQISSGEKKQASDLAILQKGMRDMLQWAQDIEHDGASSKAAFLRQFASITEGMQDVYGDLESGATSQEQQLIQSSVTMMRKLVENTASDISDEVKKQAHARLDAMHEALQRVLKDETLSKEQRAEAYKQIQEEARVDIAKLMGEVDVDSAAFKKYSSELKSEDKAVSSMLTATGKSAADLKARTTDSEHQFDQNLADKAADVMRSMVDATGAAESLARKEHDIIAGGLKDAEAKALADWKRDFSTLEDVTQTAHDAGNMALESGHETAATRRQATSELGDLDGALHLLEGATGKDLFEIQSGMAAEAEKSKIGILGSEQNRDILLRELYQLLSATKDAGMQATTMRAAKLEDVQANLDKSIKRWADGGNAQIAEQMVNAHKFESQLLQDMADMKHALWEDNALDNSTKQTASMQREQFAQMRSKLLNARADADEKVAQLQAALSKQLSAMGLGGEQAAAQLASFLNTMAFSLAHGQENGFEDLVGKLESTFGLSIQGDKHLDNLLNGALTALDKKQRAGIDLLSSAAHNVELATQVVDSTQREAMSAMSSEKQLEAMTDEELREKIEKLLLVVEKIKQRDGVYVTEAPTPPPSPMTDLLKSEAEHHEGFFIPHDFYNLEAPVVEETRNLLKGGAAEEADTGTEAIPNATSSENTTSTALLEQKANVLELTNRDALHMVSAIGFRKHRQTKARQLLLERLEHALTGYEGAQQHRDEVEAEQVGLVNALHARLPEARRT